MSHRFMYLLQTFQSYNCIQTYTIQFNETKKCFNNFVNGSYKFINGKIGN